MNKKSKPFCLLSKWIPASIRQDQEYKSAIVRVSIGVFMSAYLGIGTGIGYFSITTHNFFILLSSFMVYSLIVLALILRSPGSTPRKYIVNIIDIIYVTISSLMVGKSDSPFYLLYILIFISQGGRFGRPYLFAAAGFSVISYSLVCLLDPDFSNHMLESSFKLIALVVLPLYLNAMLKTIQTARQDADAANASKSRFLATMSHEIRTPMSGAIGMINLLKTTALNEEQNVYVSGLSTSANRLHMLINDILDFSKIEAGKLTLEKRSFHMADTFEEVTAMLGSLAKQKKIGFTCHVDDSVPKNLMGDSYRLCQIILNLAGNAIKFTEQGEVCVTAKVTGDNDTLRLEITDTGIGIPEAHLAHVFEGFNQADSSTTRRFGGTGLGTTIARELVRLMDGQIGAISKFGEGSTFWFEIPLQAATEADSPSPMNNIQDTTANLLPATGRLNVLLADDSEINALFISTTLRQAGHNVDVVANGKLAVERLRSNSYDIVFMDMHMPEMDGIAATKAWRAEENTSESTPIIALTANITDDDRLACLRAGMNEFLSKPVSAERLGEILLNYTSGK